MLSSLDGQEPGISNLLENLYLDNNRELQQDFGLMFMKVLFDNAMQLGTTLPLKMGILDEQKHVSLRILHPTPGLLATVSESKIVFAS